MGARDLTDELALGGGGRSLGGEEEPSSRWAMRCRRALGCRRSLSGRRATV